MISAYHKRVMKLLRKTYKSWTIIGWPDSEENLGHLAGLSYTNLRLDALITMEDGRAFCVEIQSELHDGNSNAWDDELGKYRRESNDHLKKQICSKLCLNMTELWPDEHATDIEILDAINEAARHARRPEYNRRTELERRFNWNSSKLNTPSQFQNKKTEWIERRLESKSKLSRNNSFKRGDR
jgi:hypothetical protein